MTIEHIAVYVSDLEKAKDFFTVYFGADCGSRYENRVTGFSSYFLSFEGGARLELMHLPLLETSETVRTGTGYSHIAFRTGSRDRVDALTERLKDDGYEVKSGPRVTGDGYYESCIVGFEGNLIEITV